MVIAIIGKDNGEKRQAIRNKFYNKSTKYKCGKIVKPDSYDENIHEVCSN